MLMMINQLSGLREQLLGAHSEQRNMAALLLEKQQQQSSDESDVCCSVKINVVRAVVLERLRAAAELMCSLFQREMQTLETLLERQDKLLETFNDNKGLLDLNNIGLFTHVHHKLKFG